MTSPIDTGEAEIRALVEERGRCVRAKDLDGLMASVAPDSVSYDVVNPLRYVGAAEVRKRAHQWFASFATAIGCDTRDLTVATGGDVAFSHCLTHVHGTTTKGPTIDMWLRTTVCYRRVAGRWLVTHEHSSVPFDTTNGQASLGLEP